MSVSPAILLVSFTVGVPLMLLALGVLYHAYVYSRQLAVDPLAGHVDALATESAEELLFALQEAVEEMHGQLAHQRDTLAGMLSEPVAAFATVAPIAPDETFRVGVVEDADHGRPMAAGEFVGGSAPRNALMPRTDIAALADQGLSDRAIARQLNIGLEEVRIARMRSPR